LFEFGHFTLFLGPLVFRVFQLRNEFGVVVLVVDRTAAAGTVLADRAVVFFRMANFVDQLLQVFTAALQAVDRLVQATRKNKIDIDPIPRAIEQHNARPTFLCAFCRSRSPARVSGCSARGPEC